MFVDAGEVGFVREDVRFPSRARSDLLLHQIQLYRLGRRINVPNRVGGDQHPIADAPIAGRHNKIVDQPVSGVDHRVMQMADGSVFGVVVIAVHCFEAAQMRVTARAVETGGRGGGIELRTAFQPALRLAFTEIELCQSWSIS